MASEERTRLPKLSGAHPGILYYPPTRMTCEVPEQEGECGKPVVAVSMRKLQGKHRVIASYCQEHIIHMAAALAEAAQEYADGLQEWAEREATGNETQRKG